MVGLLDDLKTRAAAKQAQDALNSHTAPEADEVLAVALPALFRIHTKLSELASQMRVLEEQVPVSLSLPGVGPVSGFVQDGYEVSSEGMPPQAVTLRCNLRQKKPRNLQIVCPSVNTWMDRIRGLGLGAKVLRVEASGRNEKGVIALEGTLSALLQFTVDFDKGAVQVYSRNFYELGERRQWFNPANVTEQWCEELLKFVLRQDNTFLQYEVSGDVRDQLRRRLEWEKQKKKGLIESIEIRLAGNKLKNLLKRPPPLKVHFGARSWDLATHDGAFTMGRVADCDLCLRRQSVSRFHARIECHDGVYHLTDESTNGTNVRFSDGRSETLHKSSVILKGGGLIGLASSATDDNPDVIRFEM